MKIQAVKKLYYATVGTLSVVSLLWHSRRGCERYRGAFVNIGCGPKYVEGMINIDGNVFRKKDIWLDVSWGLPFAENCVQGIYASHVMEHFRVGRVRSLLKEFYRVLEPGGGLRLVVPSLECAIQAYIDGRADRLPDWPERFDSMGGRIYNFLLCANQHYLIFDFTFLAELLSEAGFEPPTRHQARASRFFAARHMAYESDPALVDRSLYVEARKPACHPNGVPRSSASSGAGVG